MSKLQDPHLKGAWKRAMIQAELAAQIKPVREKKARVESDASSD
jgi:protein involved in temperature-dependent protein secretion